MENRTKGGPPPFATELRDQLGIPTECYLCGGALSWESASLDHVHPVSQGGTHAIDNLRWAHKECNLVKSQFTVDEFCEIARRILAHQ